MMDYFSNNHYRFLDEKRQINMKSINELMIQQSWIICLQTAPCFQKLSLYPNIDGLVQERRNSSALAMDLCLSCTNPWIYNCWPYIFFGFQFPKKYSVKVTVTIQHCENITMMIFVVLLQLIID